MQGAQRIAFAEPGVTPKEAGGRAYGPWLRLQKLAVIAVVRRLVTFQVRGDVLSRQGATEPTSLTNCPERVDPSLPTSCTPLVRPVQ